ncbi:uncharacterized protein LOC130723394 isoform X2 [Lotus japonicus]|uniref:uncharacterized protein LOC130723394 isoform X2 n=1 Tax=Lotus japonicus TaxID=34305 RepID=UPI00258A3E5A|nr:uncharacterized protein LOC130723394 isoform X2 [Lotus japonicus]
MGSPLRDISNEIPLSSCVQGDNSCGSSASKRKRNCIGLDPNATAPIKKADRNLGKKSNRGRSIRRPNMQRSKKRINMMVHLEEDLMCSESTHIDDTNWIYRNAIFDSAESQSYLDFGDMNMPCKHCGAILWYQERSEKTRDSTSPDFSICCMKGKILLPYLADSPSLLYNLLTDNDPRSRHFLENIRSYNNMFSFTSIGGKVDCGLNDGRGPPQFVISGQNYHRIGSLLPSEGDSPKFAQLYIYDTRNEIHNRMKHFRYVVDSI